MRKRDLGILLLSVFAIFISVQHEGTLSFREEWYYAADQATPAKAEREPLPPPVVADLNGDGHSEIVLVTSDAKLQVLDPGSRGWGRSSTIRHTTVRAEASLLPTRVRVTSGRRPVALAVGSLDAARAVVGDRGGGGGGAAAAAPVKRVVVVVTAGWSILCFDQNLRLLWENNVQEEFPRSSHHREVAVLITNYTMHEGDRGAVIVGGSMEVAPHRLDGAGGVLEAEREVESHRQATRPGEELEDVTERGGGGQERHFSYFAYAGNSGALRWKHNSRDFHRDASALSEQLLPQHNYKLDANALNTRHFGEVECREFRESVLAAMPHRWDHRDDTRFELAHWFKHRRRHHKAQGGATQAAAAATAASTGHGRSGEAAAASANGHGHHSNPVLRAVRRTVALAGSKQQRRGANGTVGHALPPNAIVAHLKEGIEAIHLYSGRTICKLLLSPHGLHADVNGDGVLDHVQASGGHGNDIRTVVGFDEPMKACWAVATSGVPVREMLFNGSICRGPSSLLENSWVTGRWASWQSDAMGPTLEVATPVLLPRSDGHHHRPGSHGDAVFLNSRGDLTAYDPEGIFGHRGIHGQRRWHISTAASWHNALAPSGIQTDRTVPTLAAISLRTGGRPTVVLAAGEAAAVMVSPSGTKVAEFQLPSPPLAPTLVADFNDDGWNDLIVSAVNGYYGFLQVRQPGATLLSALLGVLILAMCIVFLTQHLNQPKGKPPPRRPTDH